MNGHDIKLMKFKEYLTKKINTHLFIANKLCITECEKHKAVVAELEAVKDDFINMVWRD